MGQFLEAHGPASWTHAAVYKRDNASNNVEGKGGQPRLSAVICMDSVACVCLHKYTYMHTHAFTEREVIFFCCLFVF